MPLPPLTPQGDLLLGVHQALLSEVVARFGVGSRQRLVVAERLERIYRLAMSTGLVRRFVVFGSFITDKLDPNDVDVFLLMEDAFDSAKLQGEAALLFDHNAADAHFGASIFWVRPDMLLGEPLELFLAHWELKRDGRRRGIVEIRS